MAGHTADHIHRRSGGSNTEAQWRVTLRITFIGDLEGQTRGAMAGHPGDRNHRRSGGSNSEAQWRVTLRITFIGDLEGPSEFLVKKPYYSPWFLARI